MKDSVKWGKTALVVTNHPKNPPEEGHTIFDEPAPYGTPILKITVADPEHETLDYPDDFKIDFRNNTITVSWGLYGPLPKETLDHFGADFGIWFIS